MLRPSPSEDLDALALLEVPVRDERDVVAARQRALEVAEMLEAPERARTRIATALSEITRNALVFGGGGVVRLRLERGEPAFLVATVVDRGPGIADLDRILSGELKSRTGRGLGLRGARQLLDRFVVDSSPGEGTVVTLGVAIPGVPESGLRALRSRLDRLGSDRPEASVEVVLQQNRELLRAQSELEERARQLADANRKLEAASESKDRFLHLLGHELRNMLGPLRTTQNLLARRDLESGERERMEKISARQVEHLSRLVDDLLDASRLASGKLDLDREEVDLGREVAEILQSWEREIQEAGLSLELREPRETIRVRVDRTRLGQIVGNLLSNACKFTDPGGRVTVVVEGVDGAAELTVRDDGFGIDADEMERIFEPYFQSASAEERASGGLGLGLPLVRALARAHGGELRAESPGIGAGTSFVVRLPCAVPLESDSRPVVRAPDGDAPVRGSAPRIDSGSRRVLVIDDHRDAVASLAALLELEGHRVVTAFDGPSGLERALDGSYDLVLCDIWLPEMDGFEVARRLRARPETRDVRLLALSGFGDPETVEKAIDAGFDQHLVKPLDVDVFLETLADLG